MALENFIPEIWSARLLQNLHRAQVFTQAGVVNRDYEGEIRDAGDTVRINAIAAVTVGTYTKNTNISAPETLTDATLALLIDQSKYFNFQIDDVDRAQQKPKVMDEAMREAAYALADTADSYIAGLYTGIDAGNAIGTTAAPKADLGSAGVPYNYLVDLGTILDEDNVPRAGRWAIVPPWFYGLLLKDEKFVASGAPAADARLQNGVIGQAAGFTVLVSNNVPHTTGTKYRIMAGHPIAWSYAEQVNKIEAYRPELRFADAMKGLHVYGAKIVRSTALAVLVANRPA